MPRISRLLPIAALAAACGVLPATAAAQSSGAAPSVSSNWAGYAASGSGGQNESFSSVSGTWIAPAATCTPGSPTYSAFWVGLGGLSQNSQALEQTGSEADCSATGRPEYSAWYELVPAPPVTLRINVSAGDLVSASATVKANRVTLRFTDHTRGTTVTVHQGVSSLDLSSAEWIAEAPSQCDDQGNCVPTPLTNFGTVAFSNLSATSSGHTGTISDPAWADQAIQLQSGAGNGGYRRFARSFASVTATPSTLSATGDAFSVVFSQSTSQPSAPTTTFRGLLDGRRVG